MSEPSKRVSKKTIRVTPYIVGFMLDQEQLLKVARRFLSAEECTVLENDRSVISPLMSSYFARKNIPRSFLTHPRDLPDGSSICEYCYIFDCVPGFDGKRPRPTFPLEARVKVWEEIGVPDVSIESIACRCYKWPDLSPEAWMENNLRKNWQKLVDAKKKLDQNGQQISAQSSTELDKLGGPEAPHPL